MLNISPCFFLLFTAARLTRRNVPWSEDSVKMLKREFQTELEHKTYPSFKAIRSVQRGYPSLLCGRTEAQIKSKLAHIMAKSTTKQDM